MRLYWRAASQLGVMAAIVATLWCPPFVAILFLGGALLGFPVRTVATFGGNVHAVAGLALWWLIVFLPAIAYAAVFLPSWEETPPL